MKLTDERIVDFLAALRAPAAVPGGGSASALAGAAGAALLAMVASMPKHRAGSVEDSSALDAAGRRCGAISEELARLVDEDSDAYERVMAAYRLPKGTDGEKAERSGRIQDALRGAIDAPLAVMRLASEAASHAAVVGAFGNPNAASDVGVALELLPAAVRGARLNVEINLGAVKDAGYALEIRRQAGAIESECQSAVIAARERLPSG